MSETPAIEPKDMQIINGWLAVSVDHCTCAGGGPECNYAHENGCGLEPLADITDALQRAGYVVQEEIEWGTATKWGHRPSMSKQNALDYIELCKSCGDDAKLIKRRAAINPGPWEPAE